MEADVVERDAVYNTVVPEKNIKPLTANIEVNLSRGISREDIAKMALDKGWTLTDIRAAFDAAAEEMREIDTPVEPPAPTVTQAPPEPLMGDLLPDQFAEEMDRRRHESQSQEEWTALNARPLFEKEASAHQIRKQDEQAQLGNDALVAFLIKRGWAHTRRQANAELIVSFLLMVALIVWINWPRPSPGSFVSPLQIQDMIRRMTQPPAHPTPQNTTPPPATLPH